MRHLIKSWIKLMKVLLSLLAATAFGKTINSR